jgi:hypothetical protein
MPKAFRGAAEGLIINAVSLQIVSASFVCRDGEAFSIMTVALGLSAEKQPAGCHLWDYRKDKGFVDNAP